MSLSRLCAPTGDADQRQWSDQATAGAGRARWTVRLLVSQAVELGLAESIAPSTVHQPAAKNVLQPHRPRYWKIPPQAHGESVARMERVLETYQELYDPRHPVICMDEPTSS